MNTPTATTIASSIKEEARQADMRLPWHRSATKMRMDGGWWLYGIADRQSINVVWVDARASDADDRRDFIVRACNAHDDMLAALKAAAKALQDGGLHVPAEAARAAIAKAEGR